MLKSIDWRTLAFASTAHRLVLKCWMKNRLLTQTWKGWGNGEQPPGVESTNETFVANGIHTTNGIHNNGIVGERIVFPPFSIQLHPGAPFEPARRSIR